MKLLSIKLARSIWYFETEQLNPRGLDLFPVMKGIADRYRFQAFPNRPEEVYSAPKGIVFGMGNFERQPGQFIEIPNFTIYTNGLVADTRHSTSASDEFLRDLLAFLSEDYPLQWNDDMLIRVDYLSNLILSSEVDPLASISEKLGAFAASFSDALGMKASSQAISITVGTDPAATHTSRQFLLERRADAPFSDNRYFSQAPLPTDKHEKLIKVWDATMAE